MFSLLCLSHTIVYLSQACLTFFPLSHFASTYSDWIHVVHIHLVYLCLLKEPIFHKTSPDTPSYTWFLSPLRFSWSFITNWLALHLFVMMSYHLDLEDEYRITHPLHSFNKNVHLSNKNLPWGFSRDRDGRYSGKQSKLLPRPLQHDGLMRCKCYAFGAIIILNIFCYNQDTRTEEVLVGGTRSAGCIRTNEKFYSRNWKSHRLSAKTQLNFVTEADLKLEV